MTVQQFDALCVNPFRLIIPLFLKFGRIVALASVLCQVTAPIMKINNRLYLPEIKFYFYPVTLVEKKKYLNNLLKLHVKTENYCTTHPLAKL